MKEFIGFKVQENLAVGKGIFSPPLRYQDTLVNEARIVHVVRGQSTLLCANNVLKLRSGDTILLKADNFVNNWHPMADSSTVEIMGFQLTSPILQAVYNGQVPSQFSSPTKQVTSSAMCLPSSSILKGFFDSLYTYFMNPKSFSEPIVEVKIRELIELLLQIDHDNSIANMLGQLFTGPEYKLQDVVHKHLYTNIKLDELAFLCGLSLSTFNRRFKKLYGTSPNQFLNSKRLEKAQQLIESTDDNLTTIAMDCGFDDLSYFSRLFKKYYHCSPSDLRKIR